jgi:hypothetical protein
LRRWPARVADKESCQTEKPIATSDETQSSGDARESL